MAPDKKLTILVFAGNHEQARYNLFADIASTIVAGPGFAPYLVRLTRDRLVLRTPADMARPDGIHDGTIEIIAKETTGNAGRGVAAIAMFFDEMAFIEPATSRASAEHIYAASTPALDQFGEWAMVMETSSPWQMLGEFYAIHGRALEVDPLTMEAAYPEMFTLQLASWDPYVDADRATTIPLANPTEAATIPALTTSGGTPRCFPDPGRPISVYDDQMRRLERQAPYDFRRERRAQWGTVNHPFLNPVKINEIWLPYNGQALNIQERGVSFRNYLLVADPASTHDAFAWAIGHLDPADQNGRPHVVIDLIRRRLPADYGGHLDLTHILNQLEADARAFDVSEIVTDQYGGDFVVTDLNRRLADTRRGPTGVARLLHRTRDRNMATATRFREAITLNQLHCYPCPELQQELEFLQETGGKVAAPTRGPVQTDDVAMAVMVLTELLLEKVAYQTLHTALSATRLSGRFPGGSHPYAERFSKAGRWSRRNLSNNPARGGHRRLPYRY